jgi:hypothetical protein
MFLACVELAGSDELTPYQQQRRRYAGRVIELQFSHLETAKIWAEQEATRHQNATGNAAVFETLGPFVSLAWEHEATPGAEPLERHQSHRDELVERA